MPTRINTNPLTMQTLILPAVPLPLTSLSLVSISISPDDKHNNKKLENLNDIYKNTLFSHSFTTLDRNINTTVSNVIDLTADAENITTTTTTTTNNNNNNTESRQNSKSSLESTSSKTNNSKTRSNSSLTSLSPSLKSAYLSKRATSFRRQRSIPNSFDDILSANNTSNIEFSLTSHRSSITSFGSLDCNDKHPLLISESVIDDDEDDYLDDFDNNTIGHLDDYYDDTEDYHSFIIENEKPKLYTHTRTTASHKTKGISSFLKKLHNSIQLPSITSTTLNNFNLNDQAEVPLETFSQKYELLPHYPENTNINLNSTDSENFYTLHLCGKTRRIREFRINSNYLLQYALDTSIREKGLFNYITDEEIDIFDDLLLEKYSQLSEIMDNPINDQIFDDVFYWKLQSKLQSFNYNKIIDDDFINNLKLSSIARYKLCSTITLPPRLDDLPNIHSLIDNIYTNPSLNSCHVPWLNIKDLKSGKAINKLTKSAGLLKGSNIQYVSKKCASKRWVCLNNNQLID